MSADDAPEPDHTRLHSPAVARNREAILQVLRDRLPARAEVLEIASGSGEHAFHFTARWPALRWQPSDPDPRARASIAAWRASSGHDRIAAPLDLDVSVTPWPARGAFDAIVCCNMIHISPWGSTLALLAGAAGHLRPEGMLLLYGPFFVDGRPTAASNLAFDADLRARNPAWGIRRLADVAAQAADAGFGEPDVIDMPANNCCVVFRFK
ncbi:MAG: DUF938 domain-containing protein [Burkholderiaceae bacterium]